MEELDEFIDGADSVIALVVRGDELGCFLSSDLSDHDALDILSFATSKLYNTVDSTKH